MLACKIVAFVIISYVSMVSTIPTSECDVRAHTDKGWVRGSVRRAERGVRYASFRGVPYAKQPVGDLRFKELQPLEEWTGLYDATSEGPICPQTGAQSVYGALMHPQKMDEACIHANIHVPLDHLPGCQGRMTRGVEAPHLTGQDQDHDWAQGRRFEEDESPGLPMVVMIHGGGFAFGSGDVDVYGPEYLVSRKVIVITFNYRLNVLGFLCLNTTTVPGNNGLRDMITLLRWVQTNARAFGGNPDDVTLAGQSAGASSAHLLSLSPAAEGLFKRVWLMSGVAGAGYYSTSPASAQLTLSLFLSALGINSSDPEEIHQQLVAMPIQNIIDANNFALNIIGLTTFTPVVESPLPGVTPIIDDTPEALVAMGRGKDIPLVIGFTSHECETFRRRFEQVDIATQIVANPVLVVSPSLIYSTPPELLNGTAGGILKRYFDGDDISIDNFVKLCTEQNFQYPSIRLANMRAKTGGAPVFLYQFAFNNEYNVLKEMLGSDYNGAAHIEDQTYLFHVNSIINGNPEPLISTNETIIKGRMVEFFTNYMHLSNPVDPDENRYDWPAVTETELVYQNIEFANECNYQTLTSEQRSFTEFFNSIYDASP